MFKFLKVTQNLTAVPLETGSIEFSWISTADTIEDDSTHYISCIPYMYYGDYPEDLTYFTTSSSVVLRGFQKGTGYICSVSTIDNYNIYDVNIKIYLEDTGKLYGMHSLVVYNMPSCQYIIKI